MDFDRETVNELSHEKFLRVMFLVFTVSSKPLVVVPPRLSIRDPYPVCGKSRFKEEFVTCGGVSLRDVNLQTLESKCRPGLYFAGEVLDVDAITGGFNLQAAWSTAMLAARGIASNTERP